MSNSILRAKLRRDPTGRFAAEGHVDVLLNFADDPVNLYQLRQWYGPLEQLEGSVSVAILCHRPKTARIVAGETRLKVVLAPGFMNLRDVKGTLTPKVILYPNMNYNNYAVLALPSVQHVFISHGESDKIYMASNWMKVFNYFFIAGSASRQRLSKYLLNYDVEARTMEIGRPQIDMVRPSPATLPSERTTILYAPTWEGGRPSMRYGSVATHGLPILRSLLAERRFRVIYRPHPRTGVHEPEVGRANALVKEIVQTAIVEDPQAQHVIDEGNFDWQLDAADLMITDISAVAYDWLTTGKPLIITVPSDPETVVNNAGFIADMPQLRAEEADHIVELVDELLNDQEHAARMSQWADYYYGDRTPGTSMQRFERAIHRTIAERDSWDEASEPGSPFNKVAAFPWREVLNNSWEASLRRATRVKANKQALLAKSAVREAGGADIVVCTMASPAGARSVLRRIPELESLARTYSVSFVVGNYLTYLLLKRRTRLPVYLGASGGETEYITKTLSPFAVLYLEQAKHNLREIAYHGMFHVFWGDGHPEWINSRLRGFDYILVDSPAYEAKVADIFKNFPTTSAIIDLYSLGPDGLVKAMAHVKHDLQEARVDHPGAFTNQSRRN